MFGLRNQTTLDEMVHYESIPQIFGGMIDFIPHTSTNYLLVRNEVLMHQCISFHKQKIVRSEKIME